MGEREHHPTLFFPDGDIVLAAYGDQDRLVFYRVHRFLLAHHSPIFADMFSLPLAIADHADQVYEGVPVVQMPDNAKDLTALLAILYDPSRMPSHKSSPHTALEFLGPARLATKYQIDPLRVRLLNEVRNDWPTTLLEWDNSQDMLVTVKNALLKERVADVTLTEYLADRLPEPAAAIMFAQEFQDVSAELLPAAFYQLACTPSTASWLPHDIRRNVALRKDARLVRWHILDGPTLLQAMRGREQLDSFCVGLISDPGDLLCDICAEDEDSCFILIKLLFEVVFRRTPAPLDPLRLLLNCLNYRALLDEDREVDELCETCEELLKEWVLEKRVEVWEKLPHFFGLV